MEVEDLEKSKKEKGKTNIQRQIKKGRWMTHKILGISAEKVDRMMEDLLRSKGETQGIISLIAANHILEEGKISNQVGCIHNQGFHNILDWMKSLGSRSLQHLIFGGLL